jgi:hypothetical protein
MVFKIIGIWLKELFKIYIRKHNYIINKNYKFLNKKLKIQNLVIENNWIQLYNLKMLNLKTCKLIEIVKLKVQKIILK